jgi:hypothetical protein
MWKFWHNILQLLIWFYLISQLLISPFSFNLINLLMCVNDIYDGFDF